MKSFIVNAAVKGLEWFIAGLTFYAAAAAAVLGVIGIWKIFSGLFGLFRRGKKAESVETAEYQEETLGPVPMPVSDEAIA